MEQSLTAFFSGGIRQGSDGMRLLKKKSAGCLIYLDFKRFHKSGYGCW
jgi:hypothetical protein